MLDCTFLYPPLELMTSQFQVISHIGNAGPCHVVFHHSGLKTEDVLFSDLLLASFMSSHINHLMPNCTFLYPALMLMARQRATSVMTS